ncbi:MAG: hypothetical protein QXT02_04260 [Candidatus Hadarchaeum sp.]
MDSVIESSELDWIVQKTAEFLADKVKDGPLTDRDINLAFEIFARPRLESLSSSFESDLERIQARDLIMMKLNDRAKQLNAEFWKKTE